MSEDVTPKNIAGVLVGLLIVVVLVFGLHAGYKTYNRYQRVQDAENAHRITAMQIKRTEQEVFVERQKAQVRIAEAEGIAEAQRIIDSSLTPAYLQYLAIQAIEGSMNRVIYIPSGENGIPLIRDIGDDEK